MKVITKYVANNGIEFVTEKECVEQDALICQVEKIMNGIAPLTKKDDGCRFANGYYFIQQDLNSVNEVKRKILTLIKVYVNHQWVDDTLNKENIHPSYVGRLVGEYSNIRPLSDAWYRISNIDKLGREWGQGYFVENPDKSPALQGVA